MSAQILEQIQSDVRDAMKARDKTRTQALRMIANSVQVAAKAGDDDAVAVLQRERKKRLEAATAFGDAGRAEQAAAEREEAELIGAYLPEQISDAELNALVAAAVDGSGAESVKDMGRVMGMVMPQVKGRADGNRVSAAVRERLGA